MKLKSSLQFPYAISLQSPQLIGTQEVCGPGSSNDVFLKCLVKTRQWQDTQIHNSSDCKPWLAYYRTLRHLDAELSRSGATTVVQGEGFQHKVLQWIDECLQLTQLAVLSPTVWGMLDRIHQWQGQRLQLSDVQLQAWEDSFLCEPLHYQWMSQAEILQNADSHPFNLGHNCGSLTSLFAFVFQPADLAVQQEAGGSVGAALLQQPQQQGSFGFGQGMPGASQNEGLPGWAANADGTASASAFQHPNQLQAEYLLTDEEALAAVQLNVQGSIFAGLPALETANAQTQLAGQASAYPAGQPVGYAIGQPSAIAEGGAYSVAHASYMSDHNADQDKHQSQAQMQTEQQAEAGTIDDMLESLPSNLPAALHWSGHGTVQAQGQQQGSPAETSEVAYSCSLLTCIRLCHCTCNTDAMSFIY